MGKAESNMCEECKVVETLDHFFFHCKVVKQLWREVEKDLNGKTLSLQNVMLGIQEVKSNTDVSNLLILIGKLYCSKLI